MNGRSLNAFEFSALIQFTRRIGRKYLSMCIWRGECSLPFAACCLPFVIPNRLRLLIIPDFTHCPRPRKWAKTIRWSMGEAQTAGGLGEDRYRIRGHRIRGPV